MKNVWLGLSLALSVILSCMGLYMVSVFLPIADKAGVCLGLMAVAFGIFGLVRTHIIMGRIEHVKNHYRR